MNSSALLVWLLTVSIVGFCCGYFFYRVLTAEKRPEANSSASGEADNSARNKKER